MVTYVFYVSISEPALSEVMQQVNSRGRERMIGLLVGAAVGQMIIAEDAATSRIETRSDRAAEGPVPPEFERPIEQSL